MLNLISHSKQLINPYLVLVWLFLEIQILLIMTQPPITMVQLFDLSADQRQRTTVGNSFTNKKTLRRNITIFEYSQVQTASLD